MNLQPQNLAAMYELLSGLPPFSKYDLPRWDKVEFAVTRSRMLMGSYDGDPHHICVSKTLCDTYQKALETMAHEMVHLALERKGSRDHSDHDSDFNALAADICNAWGWKFKEF